MSNVQYRSNLISVINEVESIELTEAHQVHLQKSPFWKLLESILKCQINKDSTRKSDVDMETIIKTFDPHSKTFNLGGIKLSIREEELQKIFGIEDGEKRIDLPKRTTRPKTELVSRRFHGLTRLKKQNISEALRQAAEEPTEVGREDVSRLLTLFCLGTLFVPNKGHTVTWSYVTLVENMDEMREYNWSAHILEILQSSLSSPSRHTGVAGCVMLLPYWICEHTILVQPAQRTATPRCFLWDLKPLTNVLKKINLKKLKQNQVIHHDDGNQLAIIDDHDDHNDYDDDNDDDEDMTQTSEATPDDLLISDMLRLLKSKSVTPAIEYHPISSEHDPSGTVPVPHTSGGTTPDIATDEVPVQQPADTVAAVLQSLNAQRIEDLEQQIKEKDEIIAELESKLTRKDDTLAKKDDTLTNYIMANEALQLQNQKLKEDLDTANAVVALLRAEIEGASVQEVTQEHAEAETAGVSANEPPSMYKRVKGKKRQQKRDPQYTYSGKKKNAKKQKADTPAVDPATEVIDVDLLQQLSNIPADMPKEPSIKQIISIFQQNKFLSEEEKERILKLIDTDGQS